VPQAMWYDAPVNYVLDQSIERSRNLE